MLGHRLPSSLILISRERDVLRVEAEEGFASVLELRHISIHCSEARILQQKHMQYNLLPNRRPLFGAVSPILCARLEGSDFCNAACY